MSFIAQRIGLFDSADFRNAIQKQSNLKNPIDLSIGIPEELTPEHIKAAGIHAIKNDHTVYTPANGILPLRQAIAKKLLRENNIAAQAEDVTVVPGLTTGQLLVYLATVDPGDEVIIFDPYYPPYPHLASMVGGKPVIIPTLPDFQPDLAQLKAKITKKTKLIIINSPNNPSGAVYSEQTLRSIAKIAATHNLLIISDEIYEHFVYKGKHFSIGSIYPNTITVNGFSKQYAMTGWRLGYIHGPSEIIEAINELQQYTVMSSSSISQHAALSGLEQKHNLSDTYVKKRQLIVSSLKDMGLSVQGAQGAYYVFVKAPHNMTDIEFVDAVARNNVIIVPGRAFSQSKGFVRISYGASYDTVARGLKEISKTIADTA